MSNLENKLKGYKPTMTNTNTKCVDLISYLFSVRDSVHITHLYQKDKKLSTHLALGDYYDGILGLIDEIAECYFGLYGCQEFTISGSMLKNPVKDFETIYNNIESKRSCIKESFLQNIVDEIQALTARTIYKLNYVN